MEILTSLVKLASGISFIFFILGLIKPQWALFWIRNKEKTRSLSSKIWLSFFCISLIEAMLAISFSEKLICFILGSITFMLFVFLLIGLYAPEISLFWKQPQKQIRFYSFSFYLPSFVIFLMLFSLFNTDNVNKLFPLCLIVALCAISLLVIGIFKPNYSLFWQKEEKRTRLLSISIYFALFSLSMIGALLTVPSQEQTMLVESSSSQENKAPKAKESEEQLEQKRLEAEAEKKENAKANVIKICDELIKQDKYWDEDFKSAWTGSSDLIENGDIVGAYEKLKGVSRYGFDVYDLIDDITIPSSIPDETYDKLKDARNLLSDSVKLKASAADNMADLLDDGKLKPSKLSSIQHTISSAEQNRKQALSLIHDVKNNYNNE